MFPDALNFLNKAVPFIFPGIKDAFFTAKVRELLFDGTLLDCSSAETEFICQSIGGAAPATIRQHDNGRDYLFSFFHHVSS